MKVQKPFSLVPVLNAGTIMIRGTSTMRIENFNGANGATPAAYAARRLQGKGLHVSRVRHEQRGGVLVVSALMIPVFLLLTALVVDVGNWFTHDRQLQNRADAAAFAAGVEYANNWKACVQTGTSSRTEHGWRDCRCGAPVCGRSRGVRLLGATLPSLRNTEIANQSNLDVVINSSDPNYTDDTDNTDGGVGVVADPCYSHTPGDDISPGGGQWMDVRVKERNLPSIFGGIGLPLPRRRPGARRYPAGAQRAPIPAARGAEQRDREGAGALLQRVHGRGDHEREAGPRAAPCGRPVGLRVAGRRDAVGEGGRDGGGRQEPRVQPHAPCYAPSCGDYVPVGEEVRLASRAEVDLNQTCAQLVTARYADCFHRLSQIRVWNDGNPNSQPRLTNVHVTDGCGAPADGYFSRLPFGANNCRFSVTAEVLWGDRDDGNLNVTGNFTSPRTASSSIRRSGSPTGVWSSRTGGASPTPRRANTVTIGLDWDDHNTRTTTTGPARTATATPASTTAPSRRTRCSSARRQTPAPSCS